jgi:excisionase family DNA binding protein
MSDVHPGGVRPEGFEGPLLSAVEVAELFGVHPSTIRRLARECRVPSYCVGSAPRFALEEVAAYFRREISREDQPPAASNTTRPPSHRSKALERDRLRAELFD